LNLPQVGLKCNAKPSAFAYPAKLEIKKEKKKEKVETAILSVSTKKKGKEDTKIEEKKEEIKVVVQKLRLHPRLRLKMLR